MVWFTEFIIRAVRTISVEAIASIPTKLLLFIVAFFYKILNHLIQTDSTRFKVVRTILTVILFITTGGVARCFISCGYLQNARELPLEKPLQARLSHGGFYQLESRRFFWPFEINRLNLHRERHLVVLHTQPKAPLSLFTTTDGAFQVYFSIFRSRILLGKLKNYH